MLSVRLRNQPWALALVNVRRGHGCVYVLDVPAYQIMTDVSRGAMFGRNSRCAGTESRRDVFSLLASLTLHPSRLATRSVCDGEGYATRRRE